MNNDISKKDKILSIAIVAYFLGTIIAIVIVAGMELPSQYLIMIFAQLFLAIGIIILYCMPRKSDEVIDIKEKLRVKFPIGWVLICVGLLGIIAPLATLLGADGGAVIMYSASGGFISIGVLVLRTYILDKKRMLRICNTKILARVIGHKEHTVYSTDDGRRTYRYETYEYEYLGGKFVYQSKVESHLKVGATKNIYIDPNNPDVAFDISIYSEAVTWFVCLGSILGGLFPLIIAIKGL